ncbi:MAG TPA: DASS family sodium-coupled anion symporter [Gammaproteobacteria bacterium]|nr:DASS family sodium-coupled anion symporter [Gammaproteobacteria bacterium]
MRPSGIGLWLGPAVFLLMLLLPQPQGLAPEAWRLAAVSVWMAVWWISEAIPIPATALLPIVLFPLLGIMPATTVTGSYGHHLIFLFIGGFMIAATLERWGLHRRIALHVIRRTGTSPARLVLGFMLATALLSMWISNTATTMLMVTIGLAVLKQVLPDTQQQGSPLSVALMLGIAYAASIGGIATLIGTPPNAILAGVLEQNYGIQLGFGDWMLFALPLSALMLGLCWLYLTRFAFPLHAVELPGSMDVIEQQLGELGDMSRAERRVAWVFGSVAVAWIGHGLIDWAPLAPLRDSTIAIAGALALFMIPAGTEQRRFLLDWQTAVRIPWDIIILFGGGFALAAGFSETGLTGWLGQQLHVLKGMPVVWVLVAVGLMVTFLTEVTSNTATASLLLPVLGALALAIALPPMLLMVTATLCASFAFMLPVATPPNAIVFGSRCLRIPQMARAGLWLNFLGVLLITAFVYLWAQLPSMPAGIFSL